MIHDIKNIVLNSNLTKVDTIYHIADIHIRNIKRHNEYIDIFEKLYNEIKKDTNNAITIIAGDIAHQKLEISPELVDIIFDFLNSLLKLTPVIIIAGNHDMLKSNASRLDVITPIVKNIQNKNLYYLKETAIYTFCNLKFSNMSVFDNYEKYILANEIICNNNEKKIALFHGIVNDSIGHNNFVFHNEKINTSLFNGFDMVILGDIHKHQKLGNGNIVYAGSLIQQDYLEDIDHGYVKWKIDDNSWKFNIIKNDYAFITISYLNQINPIDLPNKARIQLKIDKNANINEISEYIFNIKKIKPEITDITQVNVNTIDDLSTENSIIKIDVGDIRNISFQNNLIKTYLDKYEFSDEILNTIYDLNTKFNKKLPPKDIIRNIIWKPEYFKFSNMFSYGENNIINFKNFKGIIGIFGKNAKGKSNLLESLTFSIFDKSPRTSRAIGALNNKKNYFESLFKFCINEDVYSINRIANRTSDSITVNTNFEVKKPNSDEIISLNGERRDSTNSIIRSYIGDYDDFSMTTLISQITGDKNNNFITMRQSDRKSLFNKFIDLSIYDQLHKFANDEFKISNMKLKELDKRDFVNELSNINIEIQNNTEELDKSNNTQIQQKILRNRINEEINKYTSQLIKLDNLNCNIDELNLNKKNMESSIKLLKDELTQINSVIIDLNNNQNLTQVLLNNYNEKELEEFNKMVLTKQMEKIKYEGMINTYKNNISLILESKQKEISKFEFNKNCPSCEKNKSLISTQFTDITALEKQLEQSERFIDKINEFLLSSTNKLEQYKDVQSYKAKLQSIAVEIMKNENLKSNKEKQLILNENSYETINKNIELYYKNENSIKFNIDINNKINEWKSKLNIVDNAINNLENKIINIHKSISILDAKKNQIQLDINLKLELEKEVDCYKYYIECVEKDGIPFQLLSNIMPKVQNEINNILSQVSNFKIILYMDEIEKDIYPKIQYDDDNMWPIELSSGWERFIITIATRVALIGVSSLPHPNFMIIDEGFGVLDSENSNNLHNLFVYLKNQFDFIIIISHLDYIKDYVDKYIEINMDNNGYSVLNNNEEE